MIAIPVMYREQLQISARKFPAAAPADSGMDPERLLSIAFLALLLIAARPRNDTIKPLVVWLRLFERHTAALQRVMPGDL